MTCSRSRVIHKISHLSNSQTTGSTFLIAMELGRNWSFPSDWQQDCAVVKCMWNRRVNLCWRLSVPIEKCDIQSLLRFKFILKKSKQISQSLFCAFLCVQLHDFLYYFECIFPKKDEHAFLVFVTHSTINLSGLAYIECKRLIICCFVFFTYYDSK